MHKRSVIIIEATFFGVVALVFTAMLLGEIVLVKTILTSSLALGTNFDKKADLK